jgi:hypothetical protein
LPEAHPATPARTPLRTALWLAALFASITFLIHFLSSLWGTRLGYGYFRDELYFLVCGRHLAFGYVDQPPLVALQARLAEILFGLTPTGIRIFSFLAAGVAVGLTGLLSWQLGGRRSAQVLAMTAVLTAPVLLGASNYLSMNAFEPCFWMGSLLVVLRIADGSSGPRAWLLFGLLAGLGIENKHSTVFFLVALLLGLILSPQRRILWSRGCAAGVALLVLIALPNFLWQVVHHFPTYEMLHNIAHSDKNIKLPPAAFLFEQANILLIFSAPLCIAGLFWLAFARKSRPWRFVALTYLVFLAIMMAMHAKDYYLAPIYPVLFAAGALALAQLTRWTWPFVAYTAVLVLFLCFVIAPIVLTLLPPARYVAYTDRFGAGKAKSEKYTSPLPQILSDRFGWPQMVAGFAARYNALPPGLRARTAIFCENYGEASAVNILGPPYGLPTAISGHQNYYYWGWNGYTGDSILTLGDSREDYNGNFAEVTDLGPFDAPWIMDYEHQHYFLLRHSRFPLASLWPQVKLWH